MAEKDAAVRAIRDEKHAKPRSARSRIWVMAVEHNYCRQNVVHATEIL